MVGYFNNCAVWVAGAVDTGCSATACNGVVSRTETEGLAQEEKVKLKQPDVTRGEG